MTSPEKIETRVREVITAVIGSSAPADIALDDELHEIGIESLNILEIVVRLEQEFDIKIGDGEIFEAALSRVGDIAKLVQSHVGSS
ncbi:MULTISPECIES: acyl carrier protein [unclassified Streptomyces]|uniref:acyl carrier protein n=1 Tax=unclassified Streptomyces TaxID=2593676 RepID=UPI0037BA5C5B